MKIYRLGKEERDLPENWDEMVDWFEKRTAKHIKLVQKYCKKIADYDDYFAELIERGKVHDQSKYEDPEIDPYVYISWKYKCKDDGKEFEVPKDIDDQMNKATEHHIRNKQNKHHPECHCEKEVALINRKDRDKPPDEIVDATKMPDLDLAEMCADWFAMSEEKGGTPKNWADKNVNVRWKFTDEQKDLIYELIEKVW
jgi:hypothetical protein